MLVFSPVALAKTPEKQPAKASASVHRDGQAEARLIEVYRLIRAGNARLATEKSKALVKDYPNFQLAQLIYGDLLMGRKKPVGTLGDVPADLAALGGGNLKDLRAESQLRIASLNFKPPADAVPLQSYCYRVETSMQLLWMFRKQAFTCLRTFPENFG